MRRAFRHGLAENADERRHSLTSSGGFFQNAPEHFSSEGGSYELGAHTSGAETLTNPTETASISWHSLTAEEALHAIGSRREGLSSSEAANRLAQQGPNEIVRRKPVRPGRLLLKQFASFFVIVLLFAAALAFAVSFLPGESGRRLTVCFILGIVVLSVALSFFEEYRAQKELEALDNLLEFKTTVLRDGAQRLVDAAEVVVGDVLALTRGQKAPADARVIEAHSLRADESALTGESVGADKSAEPVAMDAPLAERSSMVFGSTYITHGAGLAVVVRTGMATEVGQIAGTLEQMAERPTPFQVEVSKMARQMTILVGVLAVFIAPFLLFVLREPLVDVALNTLSLAVATIPESLPIVLVFALALGARQMAHQRAVVRRLAVVESLGSVDTICTDKTGTLTQSAMTVRRLLVDGHCGNNDLPETHRVVRLGGDDGGRACAMAQALLLHLYVISASEKALGRRKCMRRILFQARESIARGKAS